MRVAAGGSMVRQSRPPKPEALRPEPRPPLRPGEPRRNFDFMLHPGLTLFQQVGQLDASRCFLDSRPQNYQKQVVVTFVACQKPENGGEDCFFLSSQEARGLQARGGAVEGREVPAYDIT